MIQPASSDQSPVTKVEFNQAMGIVWEKFARVDHRLDGIDRRFHVLTGEVRDVRAHAGVLHEELMHQFKLVLECLDPTRAQLADHERRIRGLERDVPVLQDAISIRR